MGGRRLIVPGYCVRVGCRDSGIAGLDCRLTRSCFAWVLAAVLPRAGPICMSHSISYAWQWEGIGYHDGCGSRSMISVMFRYFDFGVDGL